MLRFIAAFWLGICLYFGTFLAASPSFAVDNASQTRDKIETLADQTLTTVEQFLVSIPRDYYTVKQI